MGVLGSVTKQPSIFDKSFILDDDDDDDDVKLAELSKRYITLYYKFF